MSRLKILLAVVLALGCGTASAAKWKAKHVIIIGFDGWGSYSVAKADIPNIKKLMAEGSYTLKKRSTLPSWSGSNWESMFMGAPPEIHGYTTFHSRTPEIPPVEVNSHGIYPNVFSVMRDTYPKTEMGAVYMWSGMEEAIDTLTMSMVRKVDGQPEAEKLCDLACQYVKEKKPTIALFSWDMPDHDGHSLGWYTPAYYKTLTQLDGYVGRIVQATKDVGIFDDTIFILSSDHGGTGRHHAGKTLFEMESPFIICGKNIKRGHIIQRSMMQYDIAATIAAIFNLKQPQSWVGRAVTEVFK